MLEQCGAMVGVLCAVVNPGYGQGAPYGHGVYGAPPPYPGYTGKI